MRWLITLGFGEFFVVKATATAVIVLLFAVGKNRLAAASVFMIGAGAAIANALTLISGH